MPAPTEGGRPVPTTGTAAPSFSAVPGFAWATDRSLRVRWLVGPTGRDPDSAAGRDLFDALPMGLAEGIAAAAHRRAFDGHPANFEFGLGARTYQARVEPHPGGAVGLAVDVTDRQREEGVRAEAEAGFRLLVEGVPAITYTAEFGAAGMWRYVSPQVEAVLGYAAGEWLADRGLFFSRIHPDDREDYLEAERVALARGRLSCRYRMLARDGRVVWVRDDGVLVPGTDERPALLQGVMLDVTNQVQAEQDLRRALDLEREAADRLRALDEMKNTFLHAVSHELRTPLSAVLGFALTLERSDLRLGEGDVREIAGRIAVNARKLERLLSDLLDLDRLDRGIVEPALKPVDLAELVRRVVRESDAASRRSVEVDTERVVVGADAAKVERIVENLLANSLRHTPAGAHVWVRVRPVVDGALLCVEDDGPGVPAELAETVFEPFVRGPDAPIHAPGVGVGLSLVGRFAELHGGRAWVEERTGGGASFRVFLPRGDANG